MTYTALVRDSEREGDTTSSQRPCEKGDQPFDASSVGWTTANTIRLLSADAPLSLALGGQVGPIDVEYETYGSLSPAKDNVVLVAHALSGDAHAAGWDKNAGASRPWRARKPGWWEAVIGPRQGH